MTAGVRPEDKTVAANGLNLHYLDWGAAGKPTLLLLHGLRGHARSWDDVSTALCQDFHVLALDQRGRGESGWAPDGDYSTDAFVSDLTGFCDALALDSFILVGHSMGGRNGMAFTSRYPERVTKLIVVDIGPVIDPRGAKRITQEITELPEEFDSFEDVVEYMSQQNRFASDAVLLRRLQYSTMELLNGKIGWRFDRAVREQRRNGTSAPSIDLWPALPKITCPTLVVRGGETDLLGADVARQMVETIPDARLVEVPLAGHMVFEDNPGGFLAAVGSFLE
ncbi:MAG: alpha/beta hydrolase [Dehalococcoidia bacterium]|jgi:pimeloyl-ACP methyl ester carboxylesterase|nr:alpha/beta hydrolase [Dehalococcoidia bacterium]